MVAPDFLRMTADRESGTPGKSERSSLAGGLSTICERLLGFNPRLSTQFCAAGKASLDSVNEYREAYATLLS